MLSGESTILLAESPSGIVGFTQLYPSFSSTRAVRKYILNDLYVDPEYRRSGVAKLLLREAATFALSAGVPRMSLSTAHTNIPAQKLYESLGWEPDDTFRTYFLRLGD
jgi:ribosomal protein S18 acetylase RimI-like enzyme